LHYADADFRRAGAQVAGDRAASLGSADMVLRVRQPPAEEVGRLKEGSVHVSFLDPFGSRELLDALAARGVSAISMEMMPRTTLAQKMDALSSQASLAGYAAAVLAAQKLDRVLPMMMTPAGTIAPARVLVIGAGVAGLQAIATAKRLGARVSAFDVRPAVAEQVASLGARFIRLEQEDAGETRQGYAREMEAGQLERQRRALAPHCAASDIVITTAQVFGRRAPLIVTEEMLGGMRPGSVVVDLAVQSGGNVAGSLPDREADAGGVRLIGLANAPALVAASASEMYASNLCNLVEQFWDAQARTFVLDLEDEIIRACLVTHGGRVQQDALGNP
jgi:NAD(P) transhydrogenase subunit alpha